MQVNLFTQQKQTHRLREWACGCQGGKVGERDELGVRDWHIHTTICKIDNQQGATV